MLAHLHFDVLANLPSGGTAFLTLTEGESASERSRTLRDSVLTGLGVSQIMLPLSVLSSQPTV